MTNHILAVVGAQYGSEGKGVIVNHLANEYDCHVRTGAPNAGHSFYHQGQKHVQQIIPCGWTNPSASLVLGRGMLVNPKLLLQEIETIEAAGFQVRDRLYIDGQVGVLDERFHEQEGGVHGEAHARIGSTGEGVGPARQARIERNPDSFRHVRDLMFDPEFDWIRPMVHNDTPAYIQKCLGVGNVLLEGTQGSALSLIHGPWPYVTSNDTNVSQLAADAGIPARFVTRTVLVARTYPIRVAGNSGPLKDEITWDELSLKTGYKVEERTTVTKKVRRVGLWDDELFSKALILNGPTSVALTFMDYVNPKDAGVKDYDALSSISQDWISRFQGRYRLPVSMIGTGGEGWQVIRKGVI